ncbi:hypothetical protein GGQ84_002058 [Desulfitispora alkaliphila]
MGEFILLILLSHTLGRINYKFFVKGTSNYIEVLKQCGLPLFLIALLWELIKGGALSLVLVNYNLPLEIIVLYGLIFFLANYSGHNNDNIPVLILAPLGFMYIYEPHLVNTLLCSWLMIILITKSLSVCLYLVPLTALASFFIFNNSFLLLYFLSILIFIFYLFVRKSKVEKREFTILN